MGNVVCRVVVADKLQGCSNGLDEVGLFDGLGGHKKMLRGAECFVSSGLQRAGYFFRSGAAGFNLNSAADAVMYFDRSFKRVTNLFGLLPRPIADKRVIP